MEVVEWQRLCCALLHLWCTRVQQPVAAAVSTAVPVLQQRCQQRWLANRRNLERELGAEADRGPFMHVLYSRLRAMGLLVLLAPAAATGSLSWPLTRQARLQRRGWRS